MNVVSAKVSVCGYVGYLPIFGFSYMFMIMKFLFSPLMAGTLLVLRLKLNDRDSSVVM